MVIWSKPARADLRFIHDFIAYDTQHYVRKVTQDIREKTELQSGSVCRMPGRFYRWVYFVLTNFLKQAASYTSHGHGCGFLSFAFGR